MNHRFATHINLLTQVRDVQLHNICLTTKIVVPDVIKNLALGDHALRVLHEVAQQVELGCSEVNLLATAGHLAGVLVQHQIADDQLSIINGGNTGALHQAVQTDHDLFHGEGLSHVVVRTGGKAFNTVINRILSGQKEAGNLGVELADTGEQLQAVKAGHHNIQHEHVGAPIAGNRECGGTVTCGLHIPADHFQTHADEFLEHLLIVNDEGADGATVRVFEGGKVLCDFGCFAAHVIKSIAI